jgi:hypothetical protein
MPKAQKFLYGNGISSPPTAVELDRNIVKELFFNVSPSKVLLMSYIVHELFILMRSLFQCQSS